MKLKDIKKSLKNEQAGVKVPDVFDRAKRAPVNKLLTGETPLQAFKKQLVMRTLTMALVLLLAVAITLSAMWLAPDTTPAASCYARIVRVTSEGDRQSYALVANGMIVSGYFHEDEDRPVQLQISSINEFYQPKSGDKVTIYVACEDDKIQKKWIAKLESEIAETYSNSVEYDDINTIENSTQAKRLLVGLLNSALSGESVSMADGLDVLTSKYLSLSALE